MNERREKGGKYSNSIYREKLNGWWVVKKQKVVRGKWVIRWRACEEIIKRKKERATNGKMMNNKKYNRA